jgi:hypothetical protein
VISGRRPPDGYGGKIVVRFLAFLVLVYIVNAFHWELVGKGQREDNQRLYIQNHFKGGR